MANVPQCFEPRGTILSIDQLLPLKILPPEVRRNPQYLRLAASIRELGVIEPPMVYPQKGKSGGSDQYLLLDGHLRVDILRESGETRVFCLIAREDEAFTYNHKISAISPIQEHLMILKALENGVPEHRIASSLNVDVQAIRKKRQLLDGICPEAVALLRERRVTAAALREIKRVVPLRQIEIAELMTAANNFSVPYAQGLVGATPSRHFVEGAKPPSIRGMKTEDLARMEQEIAVIGRDFRLQEDAFGKNTFHLVLAVAYLRRLLEGATIVKYLSLRHREVLVEFQKVVSSHDLRNGS